MQASEVKWRTAAGSTLFFWRLGPDEQCERSATRITKACRAQAIHLAIEESMVQSIIASAASVHKRRSRKANVQRDRRLFYCRSSHMKGLLESSSMHQKATRSHACSSHACKSWPGQPSPAWYRLRTCCICPREKLEILQLCVSLSKHSHQTPPSRIYSQSTEIHSRRALTAAPAAYRIHIERYRSLPSLALFCFFASTYR